MVKLFNRLVCVFTFITDIPIWLFMILMFIIGAIGTLMSRQSLTEYWKIYCDDMRNSKIKQLYSNLWQSFKDGELHMPQ